MSKGQQLSIEFLVKFILAITLFGLGIVLMWSIFYGSKETFDISQQEFDRQIFALNCKPSEVVCVGTNNLGVSAGENILINLKIFNNHNEELKFKIEFELRNYEDRVVTSGGDLMPKIYSDELINPKSDKEYSVLFKTLKTLPKGDYVIRILVSPERLDPIPRRIYVKVE